MARTRRRRRRRSSGRITPLTLLVTMLVLVGLWFVGSDVVKSLPPEIGRALPPQLREAPDVSPTPPSNDPGGGGERRGGGDDPAANVQAIQRLGGRVDYGKVNPSTGQRSGITATITRAMVEAAERHVLGSEADDSIRPAGFDALPSRNRARGHLLGRQLGGSGEVESNLVALYQSRANSPVMRDYETMVADAASAGETIRYEVRPLYASLSARGAPRAVRIRASGNRGFSLLVEIANTPEAPVKETAVPPALP